MRKIFVIWMGSIFLLLSATPLFADCVDLSKHDAIVTDDNNHKITFYKGASPIATITLQDCKVYPGSVVRLTKGYMCDSNKIIIDGKECKIMSIESAK